ncbi:hypothetical protein M9979_16500 [Sphingomonas sp. RP10(2022)]|uniref:Terminase small subunit n=1 Tax=Sphingomonas liriopis TaxID=2949094 RepID=A0A9X2HVW0_9SPHN|nr:hypothetical protein [Sphingomonas liriopis]MCP3736469.1 hypothetical protein [Sphingomonas liriopis]
MAKPFVPWSKEKNDRYLARQAALREQTDRSIIAGIAAFREGKDVAAAIEAANAPPDKPAAATELPDLAPLLETRKVRVDGWTVEMQRDFIRTLAETGCVSHAAKAVGVARTTAYAMRQRATHGTFALAWDVAIQMGRRRLLDIAMERAVEGREEPVWYRGEQVGTRTVHNDRLLTFLLAHKPEPAHPELTPDELAAMFPRMLDSIDTLLPHPLAVRLAAERAAAEQAEEDEFES